MRATTDCGLECVKQLLPNFAAAGFGTAAVSAATALGVATGGAAVPAMAALICVAAYIGLSHRRKEKEAKDDKSLHAAIELIRKQTKSAEKHDEQLSADLNRIGFDLSRDLDGVRERLGQIESLAAMNGRSDREILDHLKKHEGLTVSLGLFLEQNFEELRAAGVRLEGTVGEIKSWFAEFGKHIAEIKTGVESANIKLDSHGRVQAEHGEAIAEILANSRREKVSEEHLTNRLRAEIEREYGEKLATERNAREAAERAAAAVFDVKDVPGIEASLREKGGQAIIDALLARVASPQAALVETHRKIAEWAYLIGNIEQAERSLRLILAVAPDDLDATSNLGSVLSLRGDLDAAEKQYRRVLDLAPRDDTWRAIVLGNLGVIAERGDDLDKAERFQRESLEINKILGRLEGQSYGLGNLGMIASRRGDLDSAKRLFLEALEIFKRLDRLEEQARTHGNLGMIAKMQGDLNGAERLYSRSLEINKSLGRLQGQAVQFGNLGEIAETRGDLDGAERFYREALAISKKLGRLEGQHVYSGSLGIIAETRGDLDGAELHYREGLAISKKLGRLEFQADNLGNLGAIAETRGDSTEARRLWVEARDLFAKIGMPQMVERVQGWIDSLPP